MIKNFSLFKESIENSELTFKVEKSDFGYLYLDFKCFLKRKKIGEALVDIIIKQNNFDKNKVQSIDLDNNLVYNSDNDLKKNRYIGFISNLEISKEERGKGYGSQFVDYIVGYLTEKYPFAESIFLIVSKNNLNAISIYKKAGFKEFRDIGKSDMYMEYELFRSLPIEKIIQLDKSEKENISDRGEKVNPIFKEEKIGNNLNLTFKFYKGIQVLCEGVVELDFDNKSGVISKYNLNFSHKYQKSYNSTFIKSILRHIAKNYTTINSVTLNLDRKYLTDFNYENLGFKIIRESKNAVILEFKINAENLKRVVHKIYPGKSPYDSLKSQKEKSNKNWKIITSKRKTRQ